MDTSDSNPTDTDPTGTDPTDTRSDPRDYSGSTTTADNVIGAPMVAALKMGWAQIRVRHAELPGRHGARRRLGQGAGGADVAPFRGYALGRGRGDGHVSGARRL